MNAEKQNERFKIDSPLKVGTMGSNLITFLWRTEKENPYANEKDAERRYEILNHVFSTHPIFQEEFEIYFVARAMQIDAAAAVVIQYSADAHLRLSLWYACNRFTCNETRTHSTVENDHMENELQRTPNNVRWNWVIFIGYGWAFECFYVIWEGYLFRQTDFHLMYINICYFIHIPQVQSSDLQMLFTN